MIIPHIYSTENLDSHLAARKTGLRFAQFKIIKKNHEYELILLFNSSIKSTGQLHYLSFATGIA